MRKIEIAASIGLICAIFFGSVSELSQTLTYLQEDVLRLHILANSDSEEDQALKLKVRDTLLEHAGILFEGCDSPEEIRERAVMQKETIRLLAQEVLVQNGCDAEVAVQLVHMDFDEKQYDEITMPAGEYDALRILIGEAEGQNWWCVMYPPLCLPAAGQILSDNETAEEYFDEETLDILENPPKFEIRFKCLEWWDKLKEKVSDFHFSKNLKEDFTETPQNGSTIEKETDNGIGTSQRGVSK
ncbi:MAG: stage II sporulation protein R [Oscillospiraceae bacterium]|nr:stage II sporulation protein R [Oscillospiraceae bacterium]